MLHGAAASRHRDRTGGILFVVLDALATQLLEITVHSFRELFTVLMLLPHSMSTAHHQYTQHKH